MNDSVLAGHIIEATGKLLPRSCIINNPEPSMLAEDFAYYAQKIPGVIFSLGCKSPVSTSVRNLHSSSFDIGEDCIRIGSEIFAQCAVDFLAQYF